MPSMSIPLARALEEVLLGDRGNGGLPAGQEPGVLRGVAGAGGFSTTLRHRSLKKPSLAAATYSRMEADAWYW